MHGVIDYVVETYSGTAQPALGQSLGPILAG